MAKGKRSSRVRPRQKRQQPLIIGVAAVAVILVIGIFLVANPSGGNNTYYKHVGPTELDRIVKGNEPVLVYFHSPT